MNLQIPKRFKLFGRPFNVVYAPDKFIENDACAFASYRLDEIQLRPSTEAQPRTEAQLFQSFMHELTHFVFYYAQAARNNKVAMYTDEDFIELVSNLYHQALSTFEYEN